jgi:choline dehydrogenase-like flavoprotein
VNDLFLQAAAANGIPLNPDYNGAEQAGAFQYQVTHKNGERCSAAKAFLTPNLSRPNLKVITHAVSAKVTLEGPARHGRRLPPGWRLADRAGAARSDPVRRRLRLAATAAALGHRHGSRPAEARHSGGA